jgi:1,4-dihydroxy-2-naphthoate polyprenyltransferase
MTVSAATPAPDQSLVAAWMMAIRPKTLPAAISPVIVGCAVAFQQGYFSAFSAAAALLVALLLQIGANLANDVADFQRGADTAERLGPPRVTQTGLLTPRAVGLATASVLVVAAVPGLFLVWLGGPLFALVGLAAIVAAVTYTAGPKPFGYLGLGEIFVFFFFGPVAVAGTAYVMSHALSTLAIVASIPIGCLVTAILVVNNLRDLETDRAAGKRTLAVRIGRDATRWEFATLLAIAYLAPIGLLIAGMASGWVLIAWATAPVAATLARQVWVVSGRALNPVLGGTARLCLWFGVTFAVGIVLG